MNILLTSAGRRSYLVNYFKQAIADEGIVVVANSIGNTMAMNVADKSFLVPHVYEDNYIDCIIEICKNEKIKYLFSLHDLEGPVLARNLDKLKEIGVNPIVSELSVIETCLDKFKTFNFLKLNSIGTPNTWLKPGDFLSDEKCEYPVIIKPRFGFSSVNQLFVNNKEELYFAFNYLESRKNEVILKYLNVNPNESATIIQEVLTGEEYGIELVNNTQKELVAQFHKRKLAMRAGETDSAQIVFDKRLEKAGKKIAKSLGHIGVLDCDLFFKKDVPYVLDMNPRFGGQYPFTHLAGANIPEVIISDFQIPINKVRKGETFIKSISIKRIQN